MPPVQDCGCPFRAGEALLGTATKGTSYGHVTQTYFTELGGKQRSTYAVGQSSSQTRHRVLAVAALDKSLRMV